MRLVDVTSEDVRRGVMRLVDVTPGDVTPGGRDAGGCDAGGRDAGGRDGGGRDAGGCAADVVRESRLLQAVVNYGHLA